MSKNKLKANLFICNGDVAVIFPTSPKETNKRKPTIF